MFPNHILPLPVSLHFFETYPLPPHAHADHASSSPTAHASSSHPDHTSTTGVSSVPVDRPKRQVTP